MANIYHQVLMQAGRQTIYEAVTTQPGLSKWWVADCSVKPEIGFVNEFRVAGHGSNKMNIRVLQPDTFVECNFHWARHLTMFKALCETGISKLDQEQERSEVKAVHEGKLESSEC